MSSLWDGSVTINETVNTFSKHKRPSPIFMKNKSADLARGAVDSLRKMNRFIKGRLLSASENCSGRTTKLQAGMTVEAAFVLPLFLFFFLNLMSSIEMIRLHGQLELALWENGRQMAAGVYAVHNLAEKERTGAAEAGVTLLTDLAVREGIVRYVGADYLNESPLRYGVNGLNFLESSFLKENDCIDIKLTYQVSPWISVPGFRSFRMAGRYFSRAWTGYGLPEGAEEEDCVYVTEYGEVYHETIDCSYLSRNIRAVSLAEVFVSRNNAGEKYTRCGLCGDNKPGKEVYITPEGSCYHFSIQCPSLKRVIYKLERREAQKKYRPCSRCCREKNVNCKGNKVGEKFYAEKGNHDSLSDMAEYI